MDDERGLEGRGEAEKGDYIYISIKSIKKRKKLKMLVVHLSGSVHSLVVTHKI